MPKNNCLFQARWLQDELLKHWIRNKNDIVVICNYFSKDSVANMEVVALTSHERQKACRKVFF